MGNAGRVCPTKWRRKLHLVKPTMEGLCFRLMVSMAAVVLPLLFLLDKGPPGQSKSLVSMFLATLLIGGTRRCAQEGGHVVGRQGSTVGRCGIIVDKPATYIHCFCIENSTSNFNILALKNLLKYSVGVEGGGGVWLYKQQRNLLHIM